MWEARMNDLEDLFNRQPPLSEDDLAKIIAHMREQRTIFDAGGKPQKVTGPKAGAVDLTALGLAKPKPAFGIKLK
jgi:hypothetical protein